MDEGRSFLDVIFGRNKKKNKGYAASDSMIQDVNTAWGGGQDINTDFNTSMNTLFGQDAWTNKPEYSMTGQGAIQYSPKPQPDISNYKPPTTNSFGKFASDWFKKGYSSEQHMKNANSNFDAGEVYNEYGNYSKTEAARVLGISKKELENRADAAGFNSTQEYFESLQGGGGSGGSGQQYVQNFLSALVPNVYAQESPEGSGVAYQSGSAQPDQGGRTFGDIISGGLGKIFSGLGFQNIGNWGTPEMLLTETLGEATGFYQPQYGSVNTAFGQGSGDALQNYIGGQPSNILAGGYIPSASPGGTAVSNAEGIAPNADWGGLPGSGISFDSRVDTMATPTTPTTFTPDQIMESIYGDDHTLGNPLSTSTGSLSDTSTSLVDTYGGDLGQAYQDLEDAYITGAIDETKLIEETTNLKRSQLELAYDRILREYPTMEANIKAQADIAMQEIKDALDTAYGTGQAQRDRTERMYGDVIKSRVKTGKMEEKRLRNIFGALGTSESSAFMENLMATSQDLGSDIAGIKQSKISDIGEIDRYIRDSEKWAQTETAKIVLNRQTSLADIMNDKLMTEEQKALAVQELNLAALTQIANIQNEVAVIKAQLPLQLAGLEANLRGIYGGTTYNPFEQPVQTINDDSMYSYPVAGGGGTSW